MDFEIGCKWQVHVDVRIYFPKFFLILLELILLIQSGKVMGITMLEDEVVSNGRDQRTVDKK